MVKFMYYVYNFILYSILGFILEVTFKLIFNFNLHSGILFGPYCPVYGFGITIIYFIFEKIDKKIKFKTIIKILIFFIISFLLLSIFEFIGGYTIEFLFHKVFWNYEQHFLNIGKYVSIDMSLLWSIGALLAYFYLKPKTDRLYFKTNKKIIKISLLIIILDLIISLLLKL